MNQKSLFESDIDETEAKSILAKILSRAFDVKEEARGFTSHWKEERQIKADLLCISKNDPSLYFVIEIKDDEKKNFKINSALAQVDTYKHSIFDGFEIEPAYAFFAPLSVIRNKREIPDKHSEINRINKMFGFMEYLEQKCIGFIDFEKIGNKYGKSSESYLRLRTWRNNIWREGIYHKGNESPFRPPSYLLGTKSKHNKISYPGYSRVSNNYNEYLNGNL